MNAPIGISEEEEKKKRRVEELYDKALFSIESEQYDYAVTLLKSALSIDPNFVKAVEGIKLVKTRSLQKASLPTQRLRCIFFMIEALFWERMKKYEIALDKYESLFALMQPPLQMLPHLGDMYAENGMQENASTAYRAVLQADKDNVYALRKLGRTYLDEGKSDEAKSIYDRLSALEDSDAALDREIKNAYAQMTIDKGGWEKEVSFRKKVADGTTDKETEAEEKELISAESISEQAGLLRKTIKGDPDNTGLRKDLAKLFLEKGHLAEAISEYKKVVDIDQEDVETHKILAELYRERGNLGKSAKEYEILHGLSPDKVNILVALADLYSEQDAPDKAIDAYLEIIQITPDDADAHESLGKLYEHTRYFDSAIQQYEKAIELAPERTGIEENLGNLYLRNGKTLSAIERFEKVIERDKANTGVRKVLGDLYTGEKQLDKAEKTFHEITAINPDDESAKAGLKEIEAVKLDRKVEELGGLIRKYERLAKSEPDNASVKAKLENAKIERRDLQILALEHRIEADTNNLRLHFELGAAYRNKGEIDKALKELQAAASDEQKSVDSLHLIGLCFEEKDMLDMAVRQLENAASKISKMNDTKKEILYDLGGVYEKMNEKAKALARYKEIYETDISYKDVSKKIEETYHS